MYCSLTYFDDVAAIIASPQFAQRWSNNTTSLKWMELRKPNMNFREGTESQLTAKATASEQPGQTARTQTTKSLTKSALLPQCRP